MSLRTARARRPASTASLRLRATMWRARRPVAILCAALAVAAALTALRPPGPATRAVVVTTTDLTAGATLTAGDLALRDLPVQALPDRTVDDLQAVTGSRLAVPLPAGAVLVDGLVAGSQDAGPPGTVVVPVRFADSAVADLLTPGTVVDVVASTVGAGPATVAQDALVLPGPGAQDEGGLLGGAPSTAQSAPVLLAVDPGQAVALSGAASTSSLSAVIVE